ncbi:MULTISPECIES: DUF4286 family protein [Nocardia]|uniref:EthD domain-containing protein n=1 Tax=Nocardia alba TaxID=225051 RepID=A0A4V2PB90_9NOCA|nr:DUF4286 family protein [Nocardia alba]TCJ96565.1 hypothetical protein DFR71_2595 [Nocardia alba]
MHLIVFSSPRAGMDEEYNTWYTEVHIPDMLAIPGVESCTRFRAQPVGGQAPEFTYQADYLIDGDAGAVLKEIKVRSADGRFTLSPAIDPAAMKVTVWESL